jgi:hypothetical protein
MELIDVRSVRLEVGFIANAVGAGPVSARKKLIAYI